jgi:hypothetical protein
MTHQAIIIQWGVEKFVSLALGSTSIHLKRTSIRVVGHLQLVCWWVEEEFQFLDPTLKQFAGQRRSRGAQVYPDKVQLK